MSGKQEASTAGPGGPLHDVQPGPIMTLHVEVRSGEVGGLSFPQIARHRKRLQEDLRHDDGATPIQHHPTVVELGKRAG